MLTDPPRLACVFVPDFRLHTALLRLGGEPEGGLALVDPEDGRRHILAASPAARLDGVRRGMSSIAACSIAPELTVREADPRADAAVHAELEAALRAVCPVFESTGAGVVYARFNGLERRYATEGEGGFLDDLKQAVQRLGLPVRAGLAGNRFCARAAAILEGRVPGWGSGSILVPPGREAEFLAPLPIELLPDAEELIASLKRLGIRTLGAFRGLPPSGIARRYRTRGAALQRLAAGEDRGTLIPTEEPREFCVRVLSDYPVESTEALAFLLRPPVERLTAELEAAGLAARAVRWTLELEGAADLVGTTYAAAPSASARLWRDLLKVAFEDRSLPAGVLAVRLEATETGRPHREQARLTGPKAAPPGALAMTLAHLAAEVGPEGYGTLQPRTALWPEQRQEAQPGLFPGRPRTKKTERVDPWTADGPAPDRPPPAFRRVDPPALLEPVHENGRLRGFRHEGGVLRAERVLGPWEVSGGWWTEQPEGRRCWLIEGEGRQAQVFRRSGSEQWFLAGWVD